MSDEGSRPAGAGASFDAGRLPRLVFGAGRFSELAPLVGRLGRNALVVTGGRSLAASGKLERAQAALRASGIAVRHAAVSGEPSPEFIDETADACRGHVDVVVAIGGGSALDAGKAIAAMIPHEGSVADYLEGVGTRVHDGRRVALVAVPTTAGTGSEATKNAVVSRVGEQGYKKSLRAEGLVPDVALLDAELTMECPAPVVAACGLDAFTQLLESYLSPTASPFTDALAIDGIERLSGVLESVVAMATGDVPEDAGTRGEALYAAYLSGVCLANAGLGIVHGLASPLGARFPIPHGVACGTLLAPATAANVAALRRSGTDPRALAKFAAVGRRVLGNPDLDDAFSIDAFLALLADWVERFGMARLSEFGVGEEHLDALAASAGQKTNAVALSRDAIAGILRSRL